MVFADSKARARRIPWLVSRQYRQVERRGMPCPEYVASAGWLSSVRRLRGYGRNSRGASRTDGRAAPGGVRTGSGSDHGGRLFDAQGLIVQEILTNCGGCFTAPIRTTAEMVQKAQLQEAQ
jgi:hypothetical protein